MAVYKDLKRNSYYFRVYVTDIYGNRKQKERSGYKTKRLAQEAEIIFINSCKQDNTGMTFIELYNVYIRQKRQTLKPQSYRSIESRFRNYIVPFFKDYPINKINNRLYIEWKDFILSKGFNYKYNSNLHRCMVSILNYAVDFYDLDKNVATKVGNFSKGNYVKNIDFWTFDEFNKFISVVNDNVYHALFYTLYYTGMRIGECLALTWNDFQNNCVIINKTLAKEKINDNYIINTPKTISSNRKIQLDNTTNKILSELKEYYKEFVCFSDDWFIFGGYKPLSQTTVGRKKNEYCNIACVKKIRIHDFRHSHATLLLSKGVPITVISKRLGHSDLSMTLNTYSHFVLEDEDKAVQLINSITSQK